MSNETSGLGAGFMGFVIGIMFLTGMVSIFGPATMGVEEHNRIMTLEKRGVHVAVDSERRFWLWNENLRTSTVITEGELKKIAEVK